jgi:N-acetylglucosaminyl-diphospho-decaprenol L-rhamnosyltransferase
MVDLSIVIISWKMKSMLEAMLDSIKKHTLDISYELIVIDNNSQDGTAEMVRSTYPEAALIINSKNRGIARARNQGFRIAKGRYVITLDADMLLKENSLKKLIDFMDATPATGLCTAKLTFLDGTVQCNARRFPTLLAFIFRRLEFLSSVRNSRLLRNHEMAEWDRSDIREIDYCIGACQCIRHTAMDHIGLLDEVFFYGPDDIDYCIRMHQNGWKVYYYPFTSIIHYEQRVTKRKLFTRVTFLHFVSIVKFFWKYRGKNGYK